MSQSSSISCSEQVNHARSQSLFLHEVPSIQKQIHVVVMAEDHTSKLKTKHGRFPQKHKKQMKQRRHVIQPKLPKTASEVSSNWKALAAVSDAHKYLVQKSNQTLKVEL